MKKIRPISKPTDLSIKLLGSMVKTARKTKAMTQEDLAERLNVSRQMIGQIERGDQNISIGIIFEASYILGIPLMSDSQKELTDWIAILRNFKSVINTEKSKRQVKFDDNF